MAMKMRTVTNNKVLEAVKTIIEYCNEQGFCQNCIFSKFGADHWDCHIDALDLKEVYENIERKKQNHGWIS